MSYIRRVRSKVEHLALRRVDGRFDEQFHLIHAIKNDLADRLAKGSDELSALHDSFRDYSALDRAVAQREAATVRAQVENEGRELRESVESLIRQMAPSIRLRSLIDAPLADIDNDAAAFLNYAASHRGPLRDNHLWINHPLSLEWRAGDVRVSDINERIIEQPFVLAAAATLAPGSRILDIGGAESTIGLSLASLGYRVTVIEPQGYPFRHPNLTVAEVPLEEFGADEPFDAVILLSTIEHFGIGHYANNPARDGRADLDAMTLVAELLAPDGLLILTTPYGPAAETDVERIYDRARLEALLDGFAIQSAAIGVRLSDGNWTVESHELVEPAGPGRVVMVVAGRTPDDPAPAAS